MTRPVRRYRHGTSSSASPVARGARLGTALKSGLLIGLAAAGAVGVVRTDAWLRSDDVLPLRSIAVAGASGDRAKEVVAYAEVTQGEPLLALDLDAVKARVELHPFVKTANVRRVPPDGLEIEVTERRPVALLAAEDGALYLLDDAGAPVKRAHPGDGLDLPVITGVATSAMGDDVPGELDVALRVLAAYARAGAPGGSLAEIRMETRDRPVAVLADGTRVVLGEEELDDKMARLSRVMTALARQGREASSVRLDDNRRPERVAVRLRARPEMGEKPEG